MPQLDETGHLLHQGYPPGVGGRRSAATTAKAREQSAAQIRRGNVRGNVYILKYLIEFTFQTWGFWKDGSRKKAEASHGENPGLVFPGQECSLSGSGEGTALVLAPDPGSHW
jgi:hypothetical protein